jgi:hypothetical protein
MQPQPGQNGEPLSTIRAKAGASWSADFERQVNSPSSEERLAAYQAIRALGCFPPDAGFYLVAYTIDLIADQRVEEAIAAGPLKPISDRMDGLKRAHGLEVDEEWPPGGELDEWRALVTAFHETVEGIRAAVFRHYADPEMAGLFLNDQAEFENRMEAGRQCFFGPPR